MMTKSGVRRLVRAMAGIAIACLSASASAALTANDLALICNRQVPASVDLAKYYAKQRGVDENRIIELDLPDSETLPSSRLDPDVILPIRKALTERGLRPRVKCLVTFYGIPLKIGPRINQPADAKELHDLTAEQEQIVAKVIAAVTGLEKSISAADPSFRPASATEPNQLIRRADAAMKHAQGLIQDATDTESRRKILRPYLDAVVQLRGVAGLLRSGSAGLLDVLTTMPATMPTGTNQQKWDELAQQVNDANTEAQRLIVRRDEPAARARLRELTAHYLGLIESYRMVSAHIDYLAPEALKALDSALPLLWVYSYSRKEILSNPLKWDAPRREQSQILMVMRLDGPQSGTAKDIIMACVAAEKAGGLDGVFAIDSRGLRAREPDGKLDAYGDYDRRLRDLAELVQKHAGMSVLHDDLPAVFKPHSAKGVALYCGWYSVRKYVPAFEFVPGAVGFHAASLEMVSLRDEKEHGWCRGLLNDGIAATLGAVDEPYLAAFPDPVEFFGLLLTGKYPLGEVYWLTTSTVSWRMVMIGDPLYNPYAQKPALLPNNLPLPIRNFVVPGSVPPVDVPEHLPGQF